jgi:hypothetical protein
MTATLQASGLVALADRIELWPIDRLRPYERNPRTHSDVQVDQIAASMVEFGWTNPVLVDEQGGILAGHGRLLAARKLSLAEVPVIRFEHLSEPYEIALPYGLIPDHGQNLGPGRNNEGKLDPQCAIREPMRSAWRSRAAARSRPSWSRSARAASRVSSASRARASASLVG